MATTTKPVNLYQLGQEIGGSPGFRARGPLSEDGPEKVVTSPDVDDQALQSALDGHTADPAVQPPTPPDEDDHWRDAIRNASTLADLKKVLAGDSDVPGRAERRPGQ